MIIDPDMPDHWKTRMLVDLLGGDELAPLYLIRLWGHCQNRKKSEFDSLPPAAVKAICRFPGDAEVLDNALTECGFIERDGKELTVIGWAEHNASLVANWENGKRGGRPRKNQQDTDGKAKENPEKTHGKPGNNPCGTDREDREEKIEGRREDPPQTPQGGKAKRAVQLPENFEPNETNKRLADELNVSLITEFPQFCDHHRAKGSTMKDWNAALNTWIRNAKKFSGGGKPAQPQSFTETDYSKGVTADGRLA